MAHGHVHTPDCIHSKAANAAYSTAGDLTGDGGVIKNIIRHGVEAWIKPAAGDHVSIHYRGTFPDGTEFANNYTQAAPFSFTIGAGTVINGWDIVVKSMARGEKAKVILASGYTHGTTDALPSIPQHDKVVFELELLSWQTTRDVFGDGLVIATEVERGDGSETPGGLAEVCFDITAVEMDADARNEGKKLHSGESTLVLGSGLMPEAFEMVIPDMRENALVHFYCRSPRTSGAGMDYVPSNISCVRFAVKLKSWRKIEDLLKDRSVLKKIVTDGEDGERPTEGALAKASLRYFLPDSSSKLIMPPAVTDALFEEIVQFKVGDGNVVDGVDRAVRSMKVQEVALVVLRPSQAFGTAPNLLSEPLSASSVSRSSTILVEIQLLKLEKAKNLRDMTFEEKLGEMRRLKARGNELFKDERYNTAKKLYDRAVALFRLSNAEMPTDMKAMVDDVLVDCHLNLAACLSRMGDARKAVPHCSKALEMQPANVKALYRLGCAYLELGDLENASDSLRHALDLNPNNSAVVRKLRELKIRRLQQNAADKKSFSNLFERLNSKE